MVREEGRLTNVLPIPCQPSVVFRLLQVPVWAVAFVYMLVALTPAVSLAIALEMVLEAEPEMVLDIGPEKVLEPVVADVLGLEGELMETDGTWLEAMVILALGEAEEPAPALTQHLLMSERPERRLLTAGIGSLLGCYCHWSKHQRQNFLHSCQRCLCMCLSRWKCCMTRRYCRSKLKGQRLSQVLLRLLGEREIVMGSCWSHLRHSTVTGEQ